MTAPVMHLYSVIETDADPCAIPSRPAHVEPDATISFEQLKDRLWTYAVVVEAPARSGLAGYVRWDQSGVWIARTPGTGSARRMSDAASIRQYRDLGQTSGCDRAVRWLVNKFVGGTP